MQQRADKGPGEAMGQDVGNELLALVSELRAMVADLRFENQRLRERLGDPETGGGLLVYRYLLRNGRPRASSRISARDDMGAAVYDVAP